MAEIQSPSHSQDEVYLVDEIRDLIDDKLALFKRSLTEQQEIISDRLEKRLKPYSHDFRKKSNKIQWE